jgi:hypothetical protein
MLAAVSARTGEQRRTAESHAIQGRTEGSMFFSEEKNQKTFTISAAPT